MTATHCDHQLARLGMLRGVPADTDEYFTALEDVPDERFTSAVSHAIRTRQWFPTPAELRADVDAVTAPVYYEPDHQVQDFGDGGREVFLKNPFGSGGITIRLSRQWKFDCKACEDTGWAPRQCPEQYCGRARREHAAHPWVERCECVAFNPTIQRRRAANAKYAQPPEKVGA